LAFGSSLALHNSLDTYQKNISRFIAPSSFACSKFVEGGINPSKLIVKPNFVRRAVSHPDVERRGLLFVGRLSTEKGVSMLGEVATRLGSGVSIRVVGDGPEAEILKPYASVSLLGRLPSESVRLEMSAAMALVVPSLCYETFGMVVVEAFSRGLPVIASRIGALAELVRDGETGLLFSPGDCDELAKKISWALANPAQMRRMGAAAQQEYERQYTPEVNHDLLISVYKSALSQSA
jgi:glycosyltransferase involved in cell wall biosynthesis